MNSQVELERRVTDWLRAEAPARASDRVLAATLDRVAVVGQERSLTAWSFRDRSGSSRLLLIAATVALLVLGIVTAVFIGGQHEDNVLPAPSALVVPTTEPLPSFIPTAPPVAVRIPTTTAHAGSAATDIGEVTWTALDGDASNLPSADIFRTPAGFAAIEPALDGSGSRFWQSLDGLEWTVGAMPVPAEGVAGHAWAAGEHWIWSARDLRLWRSSDFATWTEIDLSAVRPPAIRDVRWSLRPIETATVGSTTVMHWAVTGTPDLETLLGLPAESGTTLYFGSEFHRGAVGDVRYVYRTRMNVNGVGDTQTRVGSIRVVLDGDTIKLVDAERDAVVAEIDARVIGLPAATLADSLNHYGLLDTPGTGAVIVGDTATPLVIPTGVTTVAAVGDRFIAMRPDEQGAPGDVWSSSDGVGWESLGPSVTPSRASSFYLLPRGDDTDVGPPMSGMADVEAGGARQTELWSSTDGLHWVSLGVTFRTSGRGIQPIPAPGGGYLGTGGDFALYVSATGARWTTVEGIDDLQQLMDGGGMTRSSTAGDRVFVVEETLAGQRRLWVLQVARPGG